MHFRADAPVLRVSQVGCATDSQVESVTILDRELHKAGAVPCTLFLTGAPSVTMSLTTELQTGFFLFTSAAP